jgi:type IV pilus assembly protein PilM
MDLPNFFGIDIGNHSIKAAEVEYQSATDAKIQRLARIDTPFGVLSSTDKSAKSKLADRIKELVDSSGIGTKKCVAGLPESSIFTRLITVPKVDESKLEELVHWEARQYIPLPIEEVQKDYIQVEEKMVNGKLMIKLLLVAAPKTLVAKYTEIINLAGLELLALETETIATSRLVAFGSSFAGAMMVMDFGANGTDLSVIKNGSMIFSQSLNTGSDALTKAISTDFGLELVQAEQYKKTYGLDSSQVEGKIYKSIEPIMQIIVDEVVRTLNFFRTHLQDSIPQEILLVGDGAKLLKLDEYLKQKIGVNVKLANPFVHLQISNDVKNEVKEADLVGYSVAIGLGLKTS